MDKPRIAEEFHPFYKGFGQSLVKNCALNILYLSILGHWCLEGECAKVLAARATALCVC